MKFVKKEDLTQVGMNLVNKKGEPVSLELSLVIQFNNLETMKQKVEYAKNYPKFTLPKPYPVFKRASIKDDKLPVVTTETPVTDEAAEKTKKIMEEIEATELNEKINNLIHKYAEVFQFINADKVKVLTDVCYELDTLILGDVTKFTEQEVIQVIADYVHAYPCEV